MANPPYGERLLDVKQAEDIYRALGKIYRRLDSWSLYLLTSDLDFERCFGKSADKRRKVYNGMIQCQLYMYKGKK
jgi:putative N6-adenine-specific DNA methylase